MTMFPARPAPRAGLYEDAFWTHVQAERVCLQHCAACSRFWYPPGPVCPGCLSEAWTWEPVVGTGRLVAWTTFHRVYFEEIPVPHTVVSAQLTEGPLLVADLAGSAAHLRLGAPMRLEFFDVAVHGLPTRSFGWAVSP
jgi:uncharacterized OB-fold protein